MLITVRFAILALSAAALPCAGIAQAAKPCMTRDEAQNLMAFAMPDLISGIAAQCKPHLSDDAFLTKSGSDLVARYRTNGNAAWPKAKKAMFKMIGDDSMAAALPDDVTKGLLTAGITAAMSKDFKSEDCNSISDIVETLAPLPPQNMASLISLILEMTSKKSSAGNEPALNVCPAIVAAK
jgi:hypothetical protein